eukprot:TRINITY_DN1015_c0_g1_i4.p1 TRINITY_DN1015_c0_g1~~TRINITY_DN1015_c0_g1_i4.p1  ORF type:complete len:513 (+),score=78.68 TRINITY_DN1015_c0_g1_i4:1237-2775(+)
MMISNQMTEYQSIDANEFSGDVVQNEVVNLTRWEKYFKYKEQGISFVRTESLRNFIRVYGIPNQYRGELWMQFSGSIFRKDMNNGYYEDLVEKFRGKQSLSTEEIERDIRRSFPNHPFYQKEAGLSSLRNVLTAFSWHNPSIGYCQSMNIVSALLLLFMDESSAFWTLCSLCDHFLPGYYTKTMVGSTIDQQVFNTLFKQYLPDLHEHLSAICPPDELTVMVLPWFLCLFINILPLETSLQVLDSFFYEGVTVLFQIGLSLFLTRKDDIFNMSSAEEICTMVKTKNEDLLPFKSDLLPTAFKNFEGVTSSAIAVLRDGLRFQKIQNMQKKNRTTLVFDVKPSTKFTIQQLQSIYDKFYLFQSDYIDLKIFSKLILDFTPWWEYRPELFVPLFKLFDKNHDGVLDFCEFAEGLSELWSKTVIEDRFEYCFRLHVDNMEQLVDRSVVYCVLDAFTRMHYGDHVMELNGFVQTIFLKAGDNLINFAKLQELVITEPLLISFLDLAELQGSKPISV